MLSSETMLAAKLRCAFFQGFPPLVLSPVGIATTPEALKENIHPSVICFWKRLLDIIGSLVGLSILAIMVLPIAMVIKLDSTGPVFFSQTRCGLDGKPFVIYKFRSMIVNAESLKATVKNESQGYIFKNKHDPRITRVGRFLRKTSLDEFPQFLNVLLGDMSLVGTRPPTLDEVAQYSDRHWQRLEVKPGLTGEWQVNGRSSVTDFEAIVDLDLRYQQRWSIWYDVKVIWQTVQLLLTRNHAY